MSENEPKPKRKRKPNKTPIKPRKSRTIDPKRRPVNPEKPHATAPIVLARTEEIARIRLDGAALWDVREYVREKEKDATSVWFIGKPEFALSDSQLGRYIQAADEMCVEKNEKDREKILETGIAQRKNLYAKAVLSGDIRTALAVLSDLEKLRGIYPAEKVKIEGEAVIVITTKVVKRGDPGAGDKPLPSAV